MARRASEQDQTSNVTTVEKQFPMYVLPMKRLQSEDRFYSYEKLEGEHIEWDQSMGPVAFLSQTWLSTAHPDPDGFKFQVVKSFAKAIITGTVTIGQHPKSFALFGKRIVDTKMLTEWAERGFYWIDCECVPQVDIEMKGKACNSIPWYVRESSLFLVVVPPSTHEKGYVVDLRTWMKRGWCLGERTMNYLSLKPKDCIVVVSGTAAYIESSENWLWTSPCAGNFTVESDREVLCAVLKSALADCEMNARERGDTLTSRMMQVITPEQLQQAPCSQSKVCDDSLNEWMEQLGFRSHDDEMTSGWTPLRMAIYGGWYDIAKSLIDQGADVDMPLTKDQPEWGLHAKGTTILGGLSFMHDDPEAVNLLIQSKANPMQPDHMGFFPLHKAAAAGRIGNFDALMKHAPEAINQNSFLGETPLHTCLLEGSTAFPHIAAKYPEEVKAVFQKVIWGGPAFCAVADRSSIDNLLTVIELRCDVNEKWQIIHNWQRFMVRATQAASFLGASGWAIEWIANFEGSTALIHASAPGDIRCVQALLAAKANMDETNAYGRSALTMAAMWGQKAVAQILVEARAVTNQPDVWGRTPAMWARLCNHDEIASICDTSAPLTCSGEATKFSCCSPSLEIEVESVPLEQVPEP